MEQLQTIEQGMTREEFLQCFLENRNYLYQLAYKYTGQLHDSEDLLQMTFARGLERLPTLRNKQSCGSWLATILHHTFINQILRKKNTFELEESVDKKMPLPPQVLITREREKIVRDVFNQASEHELEVARPFYIDGSSIRSISESNQLPMGTVKRRLHTFRSRIKERLTSIGFDYA